MKSIAIRKVINSSTACGGIKEKEMDTYIYTPQNGKLTRVTAPIERYFILFYENDADISDPQVAFKLAQKSFYTAGAFSSLIDEALMNDHIVVIRKLAVTP